MRSERPQPAATPQAEMDRQARLAREAAALRANLRRRKEQSRTRQPDAGLSRSQNEPPDALPSADR